MKKNPLMFVSHILESFELIEEYAKNVTKEALEKNEMKTDAIVRRIEIIGEATKNIPNSLKTMYPDIPWKDMAGMRDIIIHQYYGVEIDEIWKVMKIDTPKIKKEIKQILKNLENEAKSDKVFPDSKLK